MNLSYCDIQSYLKNLDTKRLSPYKISILRNITIEPITAYLKYYGSQLNIDAQINFGNYDSILQESTVDPSDLINEKTDCVCVFLKLENFSQILTGQYPLYTKNEIESEIERTLEYAQSSLKGIRDKTDALILWQGFEHIAYANAGVHDSKLDLPQNEALHTLNKTLQEAISASKNAYFVDMNSCLMRVGAQSYYDYRYWHIGRSPYSLEALHHIAMEDVKFIRSSLGLNKKVLVLDCDNVLWGGIVGEDGLNEIQLDTTYPGSIYYEFQQEILNLSKRGVIIALCSKNNEDDVWEVFNNHPSMILKKDHISASQINWQDKSKNLEALSKELNLGLDSFVYIDDSRFEIDLIRATHPEVEVMHLPAEEAYQNRIKLGACGLFESLSITEEDSRRTELYKAEVKRKDQQSVSVDYANYLKSLEMVLEIHIGNDFFIPRAAQLSQKTNQFNLTTKRYTELDLKKFSESDNTKVLCAKLLDRFSDLGCIGMCVLQFDNNQSTIDSFLLSCRILGRGVENVFLAHILKFARKNRCTHIIGEYRPTQKNQQTKNFYSDFGFSLLAEQESNESVKFRFDLDKEIIMDTSLFKKTELISNRGE